MADNNNTLVLASDKLAISLGVEKAHMLQTIKAQCFRNTTPDRVSDTQLAAYVQIASNLRLNPLLPGMLYAYPERNGGITPIIGPDGIFLMLSSNPDIEGWSTKHEEIGGEPACTATIKHKRLGEISKTVFLNEWKVANNPNWATRPRHMLEIRALKQCARQVIHGVPFDEDEYASRAIDTGLAHEAPPAKNVTPPPSRPRTPARSAQGAAAVKENADAPKAEDKKPEASKPADEPQKADAKADEAVGDFTPHEEAAPDDAPAEAPQPVTTLAVGQTAMFIGLNKVDVVKRLVNGQMSAVAEVTGAFTGKVYHIGGADHPAWADLDTPITLTLFGQKIKTGGVLIKVSKAEIATADEGETIE